MVTFASVAEVLSMTLSLACGYAVYRKRPDHPLLGLFVGFFILVWECMTMYHLCVASDIEFCPRSLTEQRTMNTYITYLTVGITFGPFVPVHIASAYMGFMLVFNYFLVLLFYDSILGVVVIVPVASIPFAYYGDFANVLRHPLVNWLHYVACAIGLGVIYCKWAAGDSVSSIEYLLVYPFVLASSLAFILNQPKQLVRDSYSKVATWAQPSV